MREQAVGERGDADREVSEPGAQVFRVTAGLCEPVASGGPRAHRAGDVEDEERLGVGAALPRCVAGDNGLSQREREHRDEENSVSALCAPRSAYVLAPAPVGGSALAAISRRGARARAGFSPLSQPHNEEGAPDAEAFFVFDVSRSMSARTANSPTRFARPAVTRKTCAPGSETSGRHRLAHRAAPSSLPSVSVNAFNATLDESLHRPFPRCPSRTATRSERNRRARRSRHGNYFEPTAKKRVVVFTTARR